MLELKNINKYYHSGTVNEMCLFDGFDLTIEEGEFVSVVGSNGSGKTSMLNIICGSIPVESGQILMQGRDITKEKEYKRNRKIGRVYQNPAMGTCPSMTILENLSLADHKGKCFGLTKGTNKARSRQTDKIDLYLTSPTALTISKTPIAATIAIAAEKAMVYMLVETMTTRMTRGSSR